MVDERIIELLSRDDIQDKLKKMSDEDINISVTNYVRKNKFPEKSIGWACEFFCKVRDLMLKEEDERDK